jgi:hypothetical protein
MVEVLALTPKEVKMALGLKSTESAKALWREDDFPGIEDHGRLVVDLDDLRKWWKNRKDRLLSEKGWMTDNEESANEDEKKERSQEAFEGVQGRGNASGWLEISKELLRADT